jgi:PadR family transcriptional regulator, regulatory protein PadR
MVSSRMGESTPQRGGRPKRLYGVTQDGVAAVARAQRAYQALLKNLTLPGVVHA